MIDKFRSTVTAAPPGGLLRIVFRDAEKANETILAMANFESMGRFDEFGIGFHLVLDDVGVGVASLVMPSERWTGCELACEGSMSHMITAVED